MITRGPLTLRFICETEAFGFRTSVFTAECSRSRSLRTLLPFCPVRKCTQQITHWEANVPSIIHVVDLCFSNEPPSENSACFAFAARSAVTSKSCMYWSLREKSDSPNSIRLSAILLHVGSWGYQTWSVGTEGSLCPGRFASYRRCLPVSSFASRSPVVSTSASGTSTDRRPARSHSHPWTCLTCIVDAPRFDRSLIASENLFSKVSR